MKPNKQGTDFFPALTGVRAIAAYLVYLYHFNPFFGHDESPVSNALKNIFAEFHTGVTIFFVLSGFLITLRYYDNVQINRNWFTGYIKNRVARIYPMLFLVTCFTFLAIAIDPAFDFKGTYVSQPLSFQIASFITSITLTKGFFEAFNFNVIVQAWSLTVEECFYISAPFLLIGIKRSPKKIFIYPVLLLVTGCLLVLVGKTINFYGFFGSIKFMWGYTFFGRGVEFFSGMALALYLKRGGDKTSPAKFPVFTFSGIGWMAICLLLMAYVTNSISPDTKIYLNIFINNVLLPIGITGFFYGLIKEQTIIKTFLASKIMVLLGKASYIFYLIHMGVFKILISGHISDNFLAKFILLNVLSILMFMLIENPLNKKIRRIEFRATLKSLLNRFNKKNQGSGFNS
jgi:peptidoglycan/LPS O-acetylase OafA/YrhL